MDDFLISISTSGKIRKAPSRLAKVLSSCGIKRKLKKGCWEGSKRIEHLGFVIEI